MTSHSSKEYTEQDFEELNAQIEDLKSEGGDKDKIYRLREKLLPILASLYQKSPERWLDKYSLYLMLTSLEPEVTADELERFDRLDAALTLFDLRSKDEGVCFFGLVGLISDKFRFGWRVKNRRMIELYEWHINTAEQWYKKFPKRWCDDYLKIINDLATLYIEESQFYRAFIQLKKYFKIFDPKESWKIENFIHPWVKFQQSAVNSNTEDKSFFDHVSTMHIEFYKKDLGAGYIEKINELLSEYQAEVVKNSGEPLLQERSRLFKQIFIVDDLLGV